MSRVLNKFRSVKKTKLHKYIDKFHMQFAYGHREILLKFAGLDETSLLTGVIQHGVGPAFTLYSEWPTPRLHNLKRSPLWVYSKSAIQDLKLNGVKDVTAIGSPWLYSKKIDNFESKSLHSEPKFLVFPRHYSLNYLSKYNFLDIIKKIQQWKAIAGSDSLEICLYWTEFIDVRWQQAAREEGVSLVCAGMSYTYPVWSNIDSRVDFYPHLREIIDSSTHCIFESFTSAIFYASDLGKNVGIFETQLTLSDIARDQSFQREREWLKKNIPGIFDTCELNSTLNLITNDLLGYDDLLDAESLANVLKNKTKILTIT